MFCAVDLGDPAVVAVVAVVGLGDEAWDAGEAVRKGGLDIFEGGG